MRIQAAHLQLQMGCTLANRLCGPKIGHPNTTIGQDGREAIYLFCLFVMFTLGWQHAKTLDDELT